MVELPVQESRSIPPGEHAGQIVTIHDPVDRGVGLYLDLEIALLDMTGDEPQVITHLQAGYPAKITDSTYLGQVLKRFGADLDAGTIDLEDVLIGKPCVVKTVDKDTEEGTFAEIADKDQLRPHPEITEEDLAGVAGL